MNERDSEAVAARLLARGFDLAPSEEAADIVLLNTCTVRQSAEEKAWNKMQALLADRRRQNGRRVLGMLGCMAQACGGDLLERLPGIDLVVGTRKLHRVPDFLGDLLEGRRAAICETGDEPGSQNALREHLDPAARPRPAVTAFVNIMQGCNHRCAFCVVPKTRGPERSRPLPEIVDECRQLIDRGVREITLLGQIVNRYGRHEMADIDGRSPFVQLLEAVDALDGLERLRFTAPHPDGYGADLVEAYARLPKLCESAHLPVQSGSDRILHLMRRGHTVEQFRSLVDQLRRVRPGIGLITDLIVGFPGETDADFEATLDLVRQVEFDQAYLFKYSHRPDTPAAAMPGQVPLGVREARHAELIKTVDEIAARRYQQFLGRHVQVLVEGPSRKNARRWTGRTRCHKIVLLEGSDRQLGQLIDVRITRTGRYTLYGDSAWIGMD